MPVVTATVLLANIVILVQIKIAILHSEAM